MAHSLATTPAAVISVSSSSSKSKKKATPFPSLGFPTVSASHSDSNNLINRRNVSLSLASVLLSSTVADRSANAARRPPPPPAAEKKDPNVNGVLAKVLASKKRKEEMKQSIAKLREKGKVIEPPKPMANQPSASE
ncbi:uncharacterized protein LOC126686815 [Mercurialis annua]|uniref:uncharacterized protein LOC126686815 n=1 Tax=Mercurialis annua TaxID=3986 RepID=UPI00215E7A04|nr:uncharacterized protein LOC126686815 [Mercurialis annua]